LRQLLRSYRENGERRVKSLLYIFRVALSGVHLLREREVVADLGLLLERYPFARVRELFELKQQAERSCIDDDGPYLALVGELEELLADAHRRSPLPDEAPARAELDGWLKRWRARR
jgi:hypothetical protein